MCPVVFSSVIVYLSHRTKTVCNEDSDDSFASNESREREKKILKGFLLLLEGIFTSFGNESTVVVLLKFVLSRLGHAKKMHYLKSATIGGMSRKR